MHVGSGPFWQSDVKRLQKFTTKYQVNSVLPYFSCQVLFATDAMDKSNGSTEVVPCSHLVPEIDAAILDKDVYKGFEDEFMNVELGQGDVLIFCRRLCHRGGRNDSDKRRNALIVQCVYLWGVAQEQIDAEAVLKVLENRNCVKDMNEDEKVSYYGCY